ncbi:MAG TPA: DUF4019 domain-containing protein [Steroidobacteraceae bacterium]|jgi:hypothetical protein
MKLVLALLAAVLSLTPATVTFADTPRQAINVTTDSTPGWLPSAEQRAEVPVVTHAFLSALDRGDPATAFALMTSGQKALQTFAQFARRLARFNSQAGQVKERRIIKITWTKDPQNAPALGIYVAVDLVSRFTNIDRDCGYIVLYKPEHPHIPFRVARQEDGIMTNAQAREIAAKQSPEAVEALWAQIARNCPNYPGATVEAPRAQVAGALPESRGATIGYSSVEVALKALRRKPGVTFRVENGWLIAEDRDERTIWSFAPSGHPAYPTAVKRTVVEKNGGSAIQMAVLCEADKVACDNVVIQFEQINSHLGSAASKGRD